MPIKVVTLPLHHSCDMLLLVFLIACQSKGGSTWAIKRAWFWSGWCDLNTRPSEPKSDVLPNWTTPRYWLRHSDSNRGMLESKSSAFTNFAMPHYYKRWNTILKHIHQIIWITERTLWRQEPNILNKAFRTRPSPCQLLFTTYSLNGDNESEQWGATPRLFAAADMV